MIPTRQIIYLFESNGGSVWYLVTRGSEGVTVVTATSRFSWAGQMNTRILFAVDPLGVRSVLSRHNRDPATVEQPVFGHHTVDELAGRQIEHRVSDRDCFGTVVHRGCGAVLAVEGVVDRNLVARGDHVHRHICPVGSERERAGADFVDDITVRQDGVRADEHRTELTVRQ